LYKNIRLTIKTLDFVKYQRITIFKENEHTEYISTNIHLPTVIANDNIGDSRLREKSTTCHLCQMGRKQRKRLAPNTKCGRLHTTVL